MCGASHALAFRFRRTLFVFCGTATLTAPCTPFHASLPHALRRSSSLTSLSLTACFLVDARDKTDERTAAQHRDMAGLQVLCDALAQNRTVRRLDISRNALKSDGARVVAGMLLVNEGVTALDISPCEC